MGSEFLPQLDEGTIAFHIIQKPGSNLSEGKEISTKIEKKLLDTYPEIEEVVSRFGVSEVPTDPMPMDLADTFIILKPEDEWVSADSKKELIEKIKETLSVFPGVSYEFTQPIEMRFNELLTGVREDIAIKIYGDDLNVLARKG
ncbi:MAG: efflux RND transporter permease subunit [Melioribacteraceae bacterium]|nr:efflux RND transporter permease subunit [Melioribacteraceae bacterium]